MASLDIAVRFRGPPKGMWFGPEPSRINTELNSGAKRMQARAEKAGVHRMGEVHRGKPKPLRPMKVVEKVATKVVWSVETKVVISVD